MVENRALGSKGFVMRMCLGAFSLVALTLTGCSCHSDSTREPRSLTAINSSQVENGVRAFMRDVARDVTQEGPTAWRKHFSDSPAFFMASEGQMAFPNSEAATKGIHDFALGIKQMELVWGDDLRIDPLTSDLAVVAVPWCEVRVDTAGKRVEENGFFTGVVEAHDGHWQFRDAHWSVAVPPPGAH
jgi:hypothetical protein